MELSFADYLIYCIAGAIAGLGVCAELHSRRLRRLARQYVESAEGYMKDAKQYHDEGISREGQARALVQDVEKLLADAEQREKSQP